MNLLEVPAVIEHVGRKRGQLLGVMQERLNLEILRCALETRDDPLERVGDAHSDGYRRSAGPFPVRSRCVIITWYAAS